MRNRLSTTQKICLSFLVAILVGSVFLALPISSATGKSVPYLDALFTATTSVCVTGLVTLPTYTTWSFFGQVVMLLLIQIGGLGVVTFITLLALGFHRRIGLHNRFLLEDALNLGSLSGIVRFVRHCALGTLCVEGVGAILYMFVYCPTYGLRGIWISVFHAISAFCNAGIDLVAEDSFCGYATQPLINLVTEALIILGGIGYVVWWDVARYIRNIRKGIRGRLLLHTKLALSTTVFLIFGGALVIFLCERNNPLTMGGMSLPNQLQVSLFQSVTTRTAGFATLPQGDLTNATSFVSMLLMFIGGSPTGTAGGVKTITLLVLVASTFCTIQGKEDLNLFHRSIGKAYVSKAVAVVCFSAVVFFTSSVLLSLVCPASALDILYETLSATATVGLTRGITGSLPALGKLIIIVTMYLGRIGPISLFIALNTTGRRVNLIREPEEIISIG